MINNLLDIYKQRAADRKAMQEVKLKTIKQIIDERYAENSRNATKEEYEKSFREWLNKQVGCPARFQGMWEQHLRKEVAEWLETFDWNNGIYLYGGAGTGKTTAMWIIAKILRANGIPTRCRNMVDWLDHMRNQYDNGKGGDYEIIQELRTDDLLILDDIGSEKSTEWTTETMYRLINTRYESLRPTFIATNLTLSETSKKYGDRVASRISEMCEIVKLDGEDLRLK